MKAIRFDTYGGPEVLGLRDVPDPEPAHGEVLVRVAAAAINPLDWHMMTGLPRFMRLTAGLRRPRVTGLGVDFAGRVVAVGPQVDDVRIGDDVVGRVADLRGGNPDCGAVAELVVVPATSVMPIPAGLSTVEAAALPVVGITALQALRDMAKVQPGEHVLVNGASGGVGTAAVQVAKALGAEVTGICSGRNVDLVRSLGADSVVDYTHSDIADLPGRYDVVLDNVGNLRVGPALGLLAPGGRYLLSFDHPHRRWLGPLRWGVWAMARALGRDARALMVIQSRREEDLGDLMGMVEAGQVRPVVDRTLPMADTIAAIEYLQTRRARGKVVITIEEH